MRRGACDELLSGTQGSSGRRAYDGSARGRWERGYDSGQGGVRALSTANVGPAHEARIEATRWESDWSGTSTAGAAAASDMR